MSEDAAQKAIIAVQTANTPDVLPTMLNKEPPFTIPPALYKSRIQGNVTLHLHIDSSGSVLPESTSVKTSSGYPPLDSAAVKGSQQLRFSPATKDKKPIGVSIDLPRASVTSSAAPLPGDTILRQQSSPSLPVKKAP